MKRFLVLPILLLGCAALAQTPGPESSSNRNQPAVNVPQTTPPAPVQSQPDQAKNAPAVSGTAPLKPKERSTGASTTIRETIFEAQPAQPTTEMLPAALSQGSADPLLEPNGLPAKPMSLIGGIALKVDPIRNRVELQPFGGSNKIEVRFDDRSHVYRDGRETTVMGIQRGDRVYVDTMLMDGHVFAKNVRVATKSEAAEARGQITRADAARNQFTMRDSLTGQNVDFELTPRTALERRGETTTAADLKPGTLIDIMIAPGKGSGTARQVLVLAVPGESFVFSGKVTHLDISTGTLSVDNESDEKNYTLHFDPASVEDREHLVIGSTVSTRATFDGQTYQAGRLTLMNPARAEQ
jgi:hypothetical protein